MKALRLIEGELDKPALNAERLEAYCSAAEAAANGIKHEEEAAPDPTYSVSYTHLRAPRD